MPHDPTEPKRKLMCISPTMLSINLDTVDEGGVRESIILQPRKTREVWESQFRSRELQKLLSAKMIVDVTASEERRVRREREMGKI